MKLCFDKRVLSGLGVVALLVLLVAPGAAGAALPTLLLAACPLSMLLMMVGMRGGGDRRAGNPSEAEAAEVARLRAELEELRGQRSAREGNGTAQ